MRSRARDNLDELIGALYDAALAEDGWGGVVRRIAVAMDANTALLQVFDSASNCTQIVDSFGLQQADVRAYETHYHALDLWKFTIHGALPPMRARALSAMVPEKVWQRSEIWNDWVRPNIGAYFAMAVSMPIGTERSGILGVHRMQHMQDFTGRDEAKLERLVPHLRRALMMSQALGDATRTARCALAGLDALVVGVVLVDAQCRLLHANAAAEAMLGRHDGLLRDGSGRIATARSAETKHLQKLVAEAAPQAVGKPSSAGGAVAVTRTPPRCRLTATVAPLPPERIPLAVRRPMAIIFVYDPETRVPPSIEILIGVYGLTHSEARLVAALSTGATLARAARQQHISLNTARWHLKHVFQKTGVGHQAQLVALIASLPPLASLGDGAR